MSQENLQAIEKRFNAGSIAQVDVNRARLSHAENIRLLDRQTYRYKWPPNNYQIYGVRLISHCR